MDEIIFPIDFTANDIRKAIHSADVVRLSNQTISWAQSSFVINLEGVQKTVSADDMLAAFVRHKVRHADAVSIFNEMGFGIKLTNYAERVSRKKASSRTTDREKIIREPPSDLDSALLQNELSSARAKIKLKRQHNLTVEQFNALPSYDSLTAVLFSMANSSTNRMFQVAFDELVSQETPIVRMPESSLINHYMASDAFIWYFRLSGLPFGNVSSPAPSDKGAAYEALLTDLIGFWRGERRSDQFLRELDTRLKSPLEVEPCKVPPEFKPWRPGGEQPHRPKESGEGNPSTPQAG